MTEGQRFVRPGGLEPQFAALLPDASKRNRPDSCGARQSVRPGRSPAPPHPQARSAADRAIVVADRLRRSGSLSFRALIADAPDKLTIVARFLALLELFRSASVQFEQVMALGELVVRWTGSTTGDVEVSDEFDEFDDPQPMSEQE